MRRLGPYRALDSTFEIRVRGSLRRVLDDALADLHVDESPQDSLVVASGRRDGWSVRWNDEERGPSTPHEHIALHDVLSTISERAAHGAAQHSIVLHGGAAAIDHRGAVFVGRSGSGKTTLTAGAVIDGAAYLCDEVAAIDIDGSVRPFHRPLGLRPSAAVALGVEMPPGPFTSALPLRVGGSWMLGGAAPVAGVYIVTFDGPSTATEAADADIDDVRMQKLRPAEALFRLSTQTLGAGSVKGAMFSRLDELVRGVPVYSLRHASWTSALDAVRSTLSP